MACRKVDHRQSEFKTPRSGDEATAGRPLLGLEQMRVTHFAFEFMESQRSHAGAFGLGMPPKLNPQRNADKALDQEFENGLIEFEAEVGLIHGIETEMLRDVGFVANRFV